MNNKLPRLYLARHCETEWTDARRKTGRTDLPLNGNWAWRSTDEMSESAFIALSELTTGSNRHFTLPSPPKRETLTAAS